MRRKIKRYNHVVICDPSDIRIRTLEPRNTGTPRWIGRMDVAVKRVAYYLLCAWIWVREAVQKAASWAKKELGRRAPRLLSTWAGARKGRGRTPPPPTVLGLIVTDFSGRPHLQALVRILAW